MPATDRVRWLLAENRAAQRLDRYIDTLRALMQEDEPIRRMAVWTELYDEFVAEETAEEFAEG